MFTREKRPFLGDILGTFKVPFLAPLEEGGDDVIHPPILKESLIHRAKPVGHSVA
jgi:hypothetical protein